MDIATLGLRIENGQAVAAAKETEKALTSMGAAGEKASKTISTSIGRTQQDLTRQVTLTTDAARRMEGVAASAGRMGGATRAAHAGMGQLNQELVTAVRNATGMEAVVGQLGYAMTKHFGASETTMAAVLLGLGALAAAHHAWGEEARKAREEQEKLTQALLDWYHEQQNGAAGELPKQIDAMTKKVKELREELGKLQSGNPLAAGSAIGQGGSSLNAWIRVFTSGDFSGILRQFGVEVAKSQAAAAKAIDEGTKAIDTAKTEVAKRLGDDAMQKLREQMKDVQDAISAMTAGTHEASDAADKATKPIANLGVQWTLNAKQVEHVDALNKLLREDMEKVGQTGAKNAAQTKKDIDDTAAAIEKQRQQTLQLAAAWVDVGRAIIGAAQNVGLMDDKTASTLNSLATAGKGAFDVAHGDVLGGSVEIISGLSNAISSLFGASKAQLEAAQRLREAVGSFRDQAFGDTLAGQIEKVTAEASKLMDALWHSGLSSAEILTQLDAINNAKDAIINRLKAQAEIEQATSAASLRAQILLLQGRTEEAQSLQDAIELFDAINAGRSDEYLELLKTKQALEAAARATRSANEAFFDAAEAAHQMELQQRSAAYLASRPDADPTADPGLFRSALDRQTQAFGAYYRDQMAVLRAQLKTQQDTQRTAEQSHEDTRRALDSLRQFRSSLDVGEFSVGSPLAQLTAARGQLDAVFRSAQLGDKSAAQNFGGLANQYLTQLRGYYASGGGFVSGQGDVQQMTDALLTQYGVQASIDEQMLASSTQQVDLMQQQLDYDQKQLDAIERAASTIAQLYDKVFGTTAGGQAGDWWDVVLNDSLAQLVGRAPGQSMPGIPDGLPYGNQSPTGAATRAEAFFFQFMKALFGNGGGALSPTFLAAQSGQLGASPTIGDVADELDAQSTILQAGFSQLIAAVNSVGQRIDENTRRSVRVMEGAA